MIKGNRRGFTLVEMLITIALVGILSPILFSIFVFGIQDYASTDKFIDQQNRVNEAIRFIRQDYEECKKVTVGRNAGDVIWIKFEFPESYATIVAPATPAPTPKNKVWTFYKETGALSLYVGDDEPVTDFNDDSMTFITMVDDLDISSSKFEYFGDTLKLYIKPNASNKKYKGRNINKQIITEFSVRNKYKHDIEVSPLPTVTPTPVP